ncbi:MAG: FtsQ-type POTRA domain-containing protein [Oscillospiraceae bacterium]
MERKKEGFDNSKSNPQIGNRKATRKRYAKFRLYYMIFFLLFAAISFYLATTKFFLIEAVDVSGTNKYTKEEIIEFANIKIGTNLFKVDKKKIKKEMIEKYEYIEDVNVKVVFPPSIIFEIKQAEPFALVKDNDDYLLVSEKWRVLERTAEPVMTRMPIVMGMSTPKNPQAVTQTKNVEGTQMAMVKDDANSDDENQLNGEKSNELIKKNTGQAMPGEYLSKENNETLAMLTSLLEAFELTNFSGVTKIDISDRLNMKIVYQDRLLIHLGNIDNLEYKLNFIKKIKEFEEESNFEGVVDATIPGVSDSTIPKELRVREMDISAMISENAVSVGELIPFTELQSSPQESSEESAKESSDESGKAVKSIEKDSENSTSSGNNN